MDVVRYYGLETIKLLLTGDGFEGLNQQYEYTLKGDEYIALDRDEKAERLWAKVIENSESGVWH